jgi:hypothetical protein
MYSDWLTGYPTNYSGCAIFRKTNPNNTTNWLNENCTSSTNYFLCQKLYASQPECNLTLASNCILRNNTPISIHIGNLTLPPNITIINSTFSNFTINSCGFVNVTINNSTFSNTVCQNTQFLNDTYLNVILNGVFIGNSSFARNQVINGSKTNYTLTNSSFADLYAVNSFIINSNHSNYIIGIEFCLIIYNYLLNFILEFIYYLILLL